MKKTFIGSIILLITVSLFAQESGVQSFTLKEAVDYSLKNNNSAKNAKLDLQKAKAFNWEILTQGLPQLNGSFEYDYYFKTPISPALGKDFAAFGQSLGIDFSKISFVLPNNITTGIQLNQLLFDARYLFGIKARKELYLTSRLSSGLTDQEIKYSVTKAYYQALTAQEAKALLLSNQSIIQKILSDTKAVFAQGLTEELDVNRLELAEANLNSQIAMQNSMADVALANLKFQMGMPLGATIILREKLADLQAQAVPDQSKFDPQNRIEYQLLSTAVILKGYDMEAKRSGYYPSLAGFLSYNGNVQTQAFGDMFKGSNWFPQGLVGIRLNVPIFDSGLKMAQVKQAKLEQMKQKNDFENFKNASELQYESAQSSYNAALSDEVNSQKSLDLSKKIFDKNQIKFKAGAGSSFELQQTEQEFTTNQLKHIQSIMNLLNAKADLDKAMGVK